MPLVHSARRLHLGIFQRGRPHLLKLLREIKMLFNAVEDDERSVPHAAVRGQDWTHRDFNAWHLRDTEACVTALRHTPFHIRRLEAHLDDGEVAHAVGFETYLAARAPSAPHFDRAQAARSENVVQGSVYLGPLGAGAQAARATRHQRNTKATMPEAW